MTDVIKGATRSRIKPLFWEYGTVSGLNAASPKLAIRSGNYKFFRNPDGSRRESTSSRRMNPEANNVVNQGAYSSIVTNLEAQLMTCTTRWCSETLALCIPAALPTSPAKS